MSAAANLLSAPAVSPFMSRPLPHTVLPVTALLVALPCVATEGSTPPDAATLDRQLAELVAASRIPGLAAAVTRNGTVVWEGGVGASDLATDRPFTPETVLNVGSVSKTVTGAAVLRLWEDGIVDLDADVNAYLPFAVRHPGHPEVPLTLRQLLTHTAALADGPAYEASYACGDPEMSLRDWLEAYLTPAGELFSPEANFLPSAPGEVFDYSNVGIGLAGLVAASAAGEPFAELTRRLVLAPLGMTDSGWYLTEIDLQRHAVPYELLAPGEAAEAEQLLAAAPPATGEAELVPTCLYSFYNLPDGLLRSTVRDLTTLLLAHVPPAHGSQPRALAPSTLARVFTDQLAHGPATDGRVQGLVWRRVEPTGLGALWGHGGADPGIRAQILWRPDDDVGVVVLANRLVVEELRPILTLLFDFGARVPAP